LITIVLKYRTFLSLSCRGAHLRDLPAAPKRALAEAAKPRRKIDTEDAAHPREISGRGGKDPARYGDWEIKGRAIDF
jgi:hypothetical protein